LVRRPTGQEKAKEDFPKIRAKRKLIPVGHKTNRARKGERELS